MDDFEAEQNRIKAAFKAVLAKTPPRHAVPILGYDLLTHPDWKKHLPPMTRRVIIDVSIDEAVKIYTESFMDGKHFVLSLESLVSKNPVTTIADIEAGKPAD